MRVPITTDLKTICKAISRSERKTEAEWAAVESDDMFQTSTVHGGYDATEQAFCFSYYDAAEQEWWFQLTLREAEDLAVGEHVEIEGRRAE
jgi:hypothetical protein